MSAHTSTSHDLIMNLALRYRSMYLAHSTASGPLNPFFSTFRSLTLNQSLTVFSETFSADSQCKALVQRARTSILGHHELPSLHSYCITILSPSLHKTHHHPHHSPPSSPSPSPSRNCPQDTRKNTNQARANTRKQKIKLNQKQTNIKSTKTQHTHTPVYTHSIRALRPIFSFNSRSPHLHLSFPSSPSPSHTKLSPGSKEKHTNQSKRAKTKNCHTQQSLLPPSHFASIFTIPFPNQTASRKQRTTQESIKASDHKKIVTHRPSVKPLLCSPSSYLPFSSPQTRRNNMSTPVKSPAKSPRHWHILAHPGTSWHLLSHPGT
jgi:hypothetical protein